MSDALDAFLLCTIVAAALLSAAGFSQGAISGDVISVTESKYGFDMTVKKLKGAHKAKDVPSFAEFDHRKNAKKLGFVMPPAAVIIFGNPKVGTQLMLEESLIALDLPLKIGGMENEEKTVSLIFTNTDSLAKKYGIKESAILPKMQTLLESIIASVNE